MLSAGVCSSKARTCIASFQGSRPPAANQQHSRREVLPNVRPETESPWCRLPNCFSPPFPQSAHSRRPSPSARDGMALQRVIPPLPATERGTFCSISCDKAGGMDCIGPRFGGFGGFGRKLQRGTSFGRVGVASASFFLLMFLFLGGL